MINQIKEGLDAMGISYTESQLQLLDTYTREIEIWNGKYGLVNAEGDELVLKHILDSLAPLSLISKIPFQTMADVGSGAGLPGIPLAIFFPDKQVYLIERSGRRVRFLKNALLVLGLSNVEILDKSLEKVKNTFDLVTFRAFRPFIPKIMKGLRNILNPQGTMAAYKGRKENIIEELKPYEAEICDLTIESLSIPGLEEQRHLVTFKKNQ